MQDFRGLLTWHHVPKHLTLIHIRKTKLLEQVIINACSPNGSQKTKFVTDLENENTCRLFWTRRELRPTMKCLGEHVPPGKGSLLLKQLVYQKRSLFLGVMGWNGAGWEWSGQHISVLCTTEAGTSCQKPPSGQGPKASLHGTYAVRQELLHVGSGCLGEVGHGAKPATGCTVIQESTDARRRIRGQHGIICAESFLFGF